MDIIKALTDPFLNIFGKLPEVFLNLIVGYITIKVIVFVVNHALKLTKMPKLKGIIVSITKFTLWLILVVFIANNLGFNKFAVALSSAVLVLVFFLNNGLGPLIMDISSGLFLCGDPDFKAGYKIRSGKGEDALVGRVLEVDMRKVRLLGDDGCVHVIPNAVFDREEWTVLEKKHDLVKAKASVVKEKAKAVIANKLKK